MKLARAKSRAAPEVRIGGAKSTLFVVLLKPGALFPVAVPIPIDISVVVIAPLLSE